MVRLLTVNRSFHARVIAARVGAEGIITELRGNLDGPYPMGDVHIYVPEEDLPTASELLMADEVESAFDDDEEGSTVIGGEADTIMERLQPDLADAMDLRSAVTVAVRALAGPERTLTVKELEAAVLSRTDQRRAFRRIDEDELAGLLPEAKP